MAMQGMDAHDEADPTEGFFGRLREFAAGSSENRELLLDVLDDARAGAADKQRALLYQRAGESIRSLEVEHSREQELPSGEEMNSEMDRLNAAITAEHGWELPEQWIKDDLARHPADGYEFEM